MKQRISPRKEGEKSFTLLLGLMGGYTFVTTYNTYFTVAGKLVLPLLYINNYQDSSDKFKTYKVSNNNLQLMSIYIVNSQ